MFHAPSGATVPVAGFYYGQNEWRIRFVPRESGPWTWAASLRTPGTVVERQGAFLCEGSAGHGFLRRSLRNPYRLEQDDGTPFYPLAIQTGGLLSHGFDGPNADGSWRNVTNAEWIAAFTGAVNLVRLQLGQGTTAGCAMPLIPVPPRHATNAPPPAALPADRYDTALAAAIDTCYQQQCAAGLRQMVNLFQDMSLWGSAPSAFGSGRDLSANGYKSIHAANLPMQQKYIRYIVARWGCYVDVWELFNEDSYAPNDYLALLAQTVRDADPYGHLLTTNYGRPAETWCDVVTWHEYMGLAPNQVDAYLTQQIGIYKSYGKVVLNTEFGNQGQLSNVDPVKWRIAVWAAFMNESSLLFWDMSGSRLPAGRTGGHGNANAYIGADSRQHFRVLNAFTQDLPVDLRPVTFGNHAQADIRTYALSNGRIAVLYVHHFSDHATVVTTPWPLQLTTGPGRFRLRWTDPADGREVLTTDAVTENQVLEIRLPPVQVDLACRVDRLGDAAR